MQPDTNKIETLLRSSKEVLLDCCLENGAVVAANSDRPDYPKAANDYRYVWPRDAAFIIYALELLGESRASEFCTWLIVRAESFKDKGLYCRRYATNGAATYRDNELQPDQSGALLWALCTVRNLKNDPVVQATEIIADTLVEMWDDDSFRSKIYDLWEHHFGSREKGMFVYTLASCQKGLTAAYENHPARKETWISAAKEMKRQLESDRHDIYWAEVDNGTRLDASVLGVCWPFDGFGDKEKLTATVGKVSQELRDGAGLRRFRSDVYDGIVAGGRDLNGGAGTWPLLGFWEVLCWLELGEGTLARSRFGEILKELPDTIIPEQVFTGAKKGVEPLGWSHAMFVIASKHLGYL